MHAQVSTIIPFRRASEKTLDKQNENEDEVLRLISSYHEMKSVISHNSVKTTHHLHGRPQKILSRKKILNSCINLKISKDDISQRNFFVKGQFLYYVILKFDI